MKRITGSGNGTAKVEELLRRYVIVPAADGARHRVQDDSLTADRSFQIGSECPADRGVREGARDDSETRATRISVGANSTQLDGGAQLGTEIPEDRKRVG